jgi:hypothetical protein
MSPLLKVVWNSADSSEKASDEEDGGKVKVSLKVFIGSCLFFLEVYKVTLYFVPDEGFHFYYWSMVSCDFRLR